MNLKCSKCKHEYEGNISMIFNYWRSICPNCKGIFNVPIPAGNIIMAFVDDSDRNQDLMHFTDTFIGRDIKTYYAFSTPEAFIECWRDKVQNPDSMWYWVTDGARLICSGACDPDDIEIFEDYFGMEK